MSDKFWITENQLDNLLLFYRKETKEKIIKNIKENQQLGVIV